MADYDEPSRGSASMRKEPRVQGQTSTTKKGERERTKDTSCDRRFSGLLSARRAIRMKKMKDKKKNASRGKGEGSEPDCRRWPNLQVRQ